MDKSCPCTRECKNRSAECRKTCVAFRHYDAERMEDYERRHASVHKARAANPAQSPARKSAERNIWRAKKRGRG